MDANEVAKKLIEKIAECVERGHVGHAQGLAAVLDCILTAREAGL